MACSRAARHLGISERASCVAAAATETETDGIAEYQVLRIQTHAIPLPSFLRRDGQRLPWLGFLKAADAGSILSLYRPIRSLRSRSRNAGSE